MIINVTKEVMNTMVEIQISEYLNADTAKDGDIVEIVGEAAYATIKDTKNNTEKRILNIPVTCNGVVLTYSPGSKTIKEIAKAWGKESKDWVGKKFQVKLVTISAFGKEQEVVRIGSFM